ncbi:hypothetical protein [Sinorhizobium americanum]|uniref:Uncharacterized protein n=1 Tax=Sinorhizobium americanum TaxID=194963 RepID=A0A4V2REW7_9HYPH|nr:hypothetical protein [Sinorhizobium americanum]TCN30350.1 hypothetical protein EV184_108224 [Sinorhizobium americanum]
MGFGAGYGWNNSPDDGRGERFLARLLARKPSEDEDAEAHVRWGKPSRFVQAMRGTQKFLPTIEIVNWPDFPDEGEEEEQPVLDWQELAGTRVTSDVRVENPDDPDQYVIVQRTEKATFQTHLGELIRLNFANEEGN